MTHASRRSLLEMGMICDLLIGLAALSVALNIGGHVAWMADTMLLRHPLRQLLLGALLLLGWHLCLTNAGAYRSYRLSSWHQQAFAMVRCAALTSICTAAWLILRVFLVVKESLYEVGPKTLIFFCVELTALLAFRLGARQMTRSLRRHGRNLRNVLIVGSNRRATSIARALSNPAEHGCLIVGFIDDTWHDADAPDIFKSMLLGNIQDFAKCLRDLALDEVILTLPLASSYHMTQEIIHYCREQGILVRCEASPFAIHPTAHINDGPVNLMTLPERSRSHSVMVLKRLVDLTVAAVALILVSPLFLLIALAIRLTSPGPIIFSQERLGIGKRRFRIRKFRTMVMDAEKLMATVEHLNQSEGPTFKLKHDPRITKIGAFLRKTSLDELPQLLNVLNGDMSLVGPRPLPLRDYRGFSEDWHRRRFTVKPGITCLWQVSGRSTIGFERWMELDIDYVDHWSIWMDVKILLQTIPVVLRGSGAM
jgi:exopolysaccharide biosynthesis polyprenyl glycosylphosphotransferase